jgi:hypothetical protein
MLSAPNLRWLGLAVAAAGLLLTPSTAQAAPQQATTSAVVLPLKAFSSIEVSSRRVFVSGGTRAPGIAVTNLDGGAPLTVKAGAGATDIALSRDERTLYAVLPHAAAISAIDTTTLKERARWATATCPSEVVVTERVWFSYGCRRGGGEDIGIGSIDVMAAKPTVKLGVDGDKYGYYSPPLLTAARSANVIGVGEVGLSSASMWIFRDGGDGTLTKVSSGGDHGNSLRAMALSPDAVTTYAVSDLSEACVYASEDLTPRGRLEAEWGLNSVAVAHGGDRLAAATERAVYLFATADGSVEPKISLDDANLAGRSLAWGTDGRRLYAVSESRGTSTVTLHIIQL